MLDYTGTPAPSDRAGLTEMIINECRRVVARERLGPDSVPGLIIVCVG